MNSYDRERFFEEVNELDEFYLPYKQLTKSQLEGIRRAAAIKDDNISTKQNAVKKFLRPGLMIGLAANIGLEIAKNPIITEKIIGMPQKTLSTLSIALSTVALAGLVKRQVSDTEEKQKNVRVDKIRNIVRKEIEKYEDEPNWKKL
jgi:hypothetical protein